jgi:hypothetical protein
MRKKEHDMSKPKADATERQIPEIVPDRLTVDWEGFCRRRLVARLPAGFIADDLKEPVVWRRVQASGKALRAFDELFLIAFDESFVAECLVASADGARAVLAKPRLTQLPQRYDRLFEDDLYKVEWNGHGYVVARKSDSHVMTRPLPNAALAERELGRLYPAPVGVNR